MPPGSGKRQPACAPLLQVDRLSARHRDGDLVLDKVSLTIGAGECVAIVGASGSGTTSLARCLVGYERPVAGTIHLDGVHVALTSISAHAKIASHYSSYRKTPPDH